MNWEAQTEKGQSISPEKRIADLATDIKKSGLTTGKATIAAQTLYQTAQQYGPNAEAMLAAYEPGQDPKRFASGFQNAFILGTQGNQAALEKSKAAAYLTQEQREIAYEMGQESKIGDNEQRAVDSEEYSGIMEMHRSSGNLGAFSKLPERMSKKHIRNLAKEYGISLKGVTLSIDANEDLLRARFTGIADPSKIGKVIFLPNAFVSKEELVRTLYHELIHVEQFREFGADCVQKDRAKFERLAYEKENAFVQKMKREGKL